MTRRAAASVASTPIFPGGTVGVMGGGQLGRMLAIAAKRMGYRVHVLSTQADSPAAQVADRTAVAEDGDSEAVLQFSQAVDVVTLEFENVSHESTTAAERYVPVRPGTNVLYTVQDRLREKTFLKESGFPCTPFAVVDTKEALDGALEQIGVPSVLKQVASGYDGSGQAKIRSRDDADSAWQAVAQKPSVLEAFVDYECEFSVLVARTVEGTVATYRPILNHHREHILDVSIWGSPQLGAIAAPASEIAIGIAQSLDAVGLICIEFFLTKSGDILVNEIAPRPHNSGHLTIEGAATSQFEQQLRAVCGLPLGSTEQIGPASAMANLLGDLWQGGEPPWDALLGHPGINLHLYGKDQARPRRKMGHLTALGETPQQAEDKVRHARDCLLG